MPVMGSVGPAGTKWRLTKPRVPTRLKANAFPSTALVPLHSRHCILTELRMFTRINTDGNRADWGPSIIKYAPDNTPRDALTLMDGVAEGGYHSVDALSDLLGHRRSRLSYFNIQRYSLAAILATSFWGSVISEHQCQSCLET
jgi:hypothetical protein